MSHNEDVEQGASKGILAMDFEPFSGASGGTSISADSSEEISGLVIESAEASGSDGTTGMPAMDCEIFSGNSGQNSMNAGSSDKISYLFTETIEASESGDIMNDIPGMSSSLNMVSLLTS
jgi:hypothetical protein